MRAVAIRRWFGLLAIKLAISRPMPDEQPVTMEVGISVALEKGKTGGAHLARVRRREGCTAEC